MGSGEVWSGKVWYGEVRCGLVWYGLQWSKAMATVEDLEGIKRRRDAAQREKSRAEGALAQALSRLKEYGCATEAEARARLEELTRLKTEAKLRFDKAYEDFQRKYGGPA